MSKQAIKLLNELKDYSQNKRKPRGGWYKQAIEDCIETIQAGNFDSVIKRDKNYDSELEKMKAKAKKKRRLKK